MGPTTAASRAIAGAGHLIELAGVGTILIGVLVAGVMAARDLRRVPAAVTFKSVRQRLGRAILLGLELLVAADIIGTITEDPSLGRVLVLAVIVLIRTFLSFTLELEISGRWPWQPRE